MTMALDERLDVEFACLLRHAIADSDLTLRDLRDRLAARGAPVSLRLAEHLAVRDQPSRAPGVPARDRAGSSRSSACRPGGCGKPSARAPRGPGPPAASRCSEPTGRPMPQRVARLLHALDSSPVDPRQPDRLTHRLTQHVGADLNPVRADHSLVVTAGTQGACRFFKA
ncbi:hypothetical protein G5V59_22395 [Nocardioides sp. W3-2-3]|uniref:hypothetical protein n=1 Tax=Nocardioides convexus TaxID=2712224 RepID=UPI002418A388|nr:hypothetical protein [Nocardioides convexus]NHA01594.1 hypothetical protein [Nocardioides convexus]